MQSTSGLGSLHRVVATARRSRSAFLISFLGCLALSSSWAAATPLFGAPDELSHMVRAAAAARGDISGTSDGGTGRTYRAPAVLAPLGDPEGNRGGICYAGLAGQSPACMSFPADRGDRQIASSAAPYPPLYYLAVGWPSRLFSGLDGLYGMRVANAALFSALIALAAGSIGLGRRVGLAYVGLGVAATPMAWFLAGSVNPSAAATSSAIAAWCGGYRLVHSEERDLRRSAWRFGLPLCVLLVLRRDSILWGGLVVLGLAVLVRRERVLPLLRSRHVLGWGVASAACSVYAWSTGIRHGASFVGEESGGSASGAFGYLPTYLKEMIGVLGWLDTPLPSGTYLLWYLAAGALLLPAIALAPRRVVLAIVGLAVGVATVIVMLGAQLFPYFQGRYALPAAVGVPLLSGLGLAARAGVTLLPTRVVVLGLASTAIVELTAYLQNLRRYSLSGQSTWDLFGATQWSPPVAPVPLLVGFHVVATLLLFGWWSVSGSGVLSTEAAADEEGPAVDDAVLMPRQGASPGVR